ncbi:Rieske (2Fe-2S) protein [Geothrix sp. 21YS21S-2]|uniref:Rieske (2Fe-2S) protein n=1 Tax=Geothrix sp. 21YS21S-2 TaxID=3068893 RepID=UPI0027BA312E|nr:Rieske (2Fe-2S) protein [Geothrix sp. 21YS21S-2]
MSAPETTLQLDRRTFCLGAAVCGMALACGCGGGGGGSTAAPPPPPPAGGVTTQDTKAALLAAPDGTVRDYRNLANFFLIKDASGIYAMTAICTHQGCTVDLPAGTKITCPCHGSQYDLSGGNLLGPAVNPLVHFAVTEAAPGGALVVHVDQTVAASARLS